MQILSCKGIGADPGVFVAFLDQLEGKNFTLKELDLTGNPGLKGDFREVLKKISFTVVLDR